MATEGIDIAKKLLIADQYRLDDLKVRSFILVGDCQLNPCDLWLERKISGPLFQIVHDGKQFRNDTQGLFLIFVLKYIKLTDD